MTTTVLDVNVKCEYISPWVGKKTSHTVTVGHTVGQSDTDSQRVYQLPQLQSLNTKSNHCSAHVLLYY